MSGSRFPGWVVDSGQSRTVTVPPVTAASARNGAALERSGSMRWSQGLTGPGATAHRFASESSTSTPCSRSIATVISMCGRDGTGLPSWRTSTPASYRAPASSRAETNCEDADASITTVPPGTDPVPRTVKGRPSPSMATPSPRSAVSTSPTGRFRMCASPSNSTAPAASPATGGTNLMTVPASPQSTAASRSNGPGATAQSSPDVSMRAPSRDRASTISKVSRERSARRTTLGPSESAARTRARLVKDLLPGSETTASTGPLAVGAGQGSAMVSVFR